MADIKFGPIYTAIEDLMGPVELAGVAKLKSMEKTSLTCFCNWWMSSRLYDRISMMSKIMCDRMSICF